MADLNSLALFAKIVETKSFSEAARRLKIPVSTLSRRIAELEEQLGVRLVERSTRSLRVTDIGAIVLEHAQRSAELSEAVDNVVSYQHTTVTGHLRLSAPPSISESLLAPLIGTFQASYPEVRVQVLVTDRFVDHISEGVDLVFRLGARKDSSLIARKILTYRHRLVASPSYLAQHPPPEKPDDLRQHRLLAFSHWKFEDSWSFARTRGKGVQTLTFQPHLSMNDYAGLVPALLAGTGIGELPPIVQPELLREGRLVEIMPKWRFHTLDLAVVHLGNRQIARHVRLFKDLVVEAAPTLFPDLPT